MRVAPPCCRNPSIRKVKERDGGNNWAVLKTRRNPTSTMSEHRYKIGQLVDDLGRATGVYRITQPLPSEEDPFRYRIKSRTSALPEVSAFC